MKMNPVLLKELKVKMRGWKSVVTLAIYLSVMILVALFIFTEMTGSPYSMTFDPGRSISIYTMLSTIQFVLIMFIAPAMTSGSISGERERQTLDLLLSTRLSSFSIVLGKLFASISHVILLIAASLPIFSIIFLFGGISIIEVLQLFGYYIITAISLGAVGIFFSAFMRKTSASNAAAYGTIAFLTIGTLIAAAIYSSYYMRKSGMSYNGMPPIMYTNPLGGFMSLLSEQFGGNNYGYAPSLPFIGIRIFGGYPGPNSPKAMAVWKGNILFDAVLTILLILLSSYKIAPVRKCTINFIRQILRKLKPDKRPAGDEA